MKKNSNIIIFTFLTNLTFSSVEDANTSPSSRLLNRAPSPLPKNGKLKPMSLFAEQAHMNTGTNPSSVLTLPLSPSSGYVTETSTAPVSPAPLPAAAPALAAPAPARVRNVIYPPSIVPQVIPNTHQNRAVFYPESRAVQVVMTRNPIYPVSMDFSEDKLLSKIKELENLQNAKKVFSFHQDKLIEKTKKLAQSKRSFIHGLEAYQKTLHRLIADVDTKEQAQQLLKSLISLVQNEGEAYFNKSAEIKKKLEGIIPATKRDNFKKFLNENEKACKRAVQEVAIYAERSSHSAQGTMKDLAERKKLCPNDLAYKGLLNLELKKYS
ncbi:MAG: hypothetical protein ACK5PQ_01575 [Alphaproteobacteria bacterium]